MKGIFKARGLVLKETLVGESDKIITVLCKEIGKVTISARGARKVKSKFLAGTQLFTYADFIVSDSGKYCYLTQVDTIRTFRGIQEDFERVCVGYYFLELTDKVLMVNMPCDDILLLLLKSLTVLEKGGMPAKLVCSVFEFKFLQLNGYGAETECCSACGDEMGDTVFFGSHGIVCPRCRGLEQRTVGVSHAAVSAIQYILFQEIPDVFRFTVSDSVQSELVKSADLFLKQHLDVKIRSKTLMDG